MISAIIWSIVAAFHIHSLGTVIWGNHRSRYRVFAYNYWMGLDKFANALMGGDHNQTISARAHLHKKDYRIFAALSWMLEKLDPGHGEDAVRELDGDDTDGSLDLINFSQLKRKTGAK